MLNQNVCFLLRVTYCLQTDSHHVMQLKLAIPIPTFDLPLLYCIVEFLSWCAEIELNLIQHYAAMVWKTLLVVAHMRAILSEN